MVQKKKSSEKLRPVINLKPLNQFLVKKSFKVDHLGVVMKLVRKGNWALSIDLTDAYFHVPILLNHRMFLKFAVGHHCYQFRCLHFGPTTAPRIFTKMLSAVLQFLREQGVQITAYLDDSLLFQNHPDYLCNSRDTALQVLNRLGFLVNLVKSELLPSQSVKFIGVQFQLNRGIVSGTQEWFAKIKALIHSSSAQNQTSALMLLRILGINNGINNSGYEVGSFTHETNSIAPVVLLESQVKRHQGVDTSEHCPAMLFSIMVVTGRECFGGSSIVTGTSRSVRGRGRGGGGRGGGAIWRAGQYWSGPTTCQWWHTSTSRGVVSGGTRSPPLCMRLWQLFMEAEQLNSRITATHVAGVLNQRADHLSRFRIQATEWMLNRSVVNQIFHCLGRPLIDLFASDQHHVLPTFCSWLPSQKAYQIDAFSLSWTGMYVYAYPPICLISRIS